MVTTRNTVCRGTTLTDDTMDRAFNVSKKLIGKGTGQEDRQAPRWALTNFPILVMEAGHLATSIVRYRMVDRYKVCDPSSTAQGKDLSSHVSAHTKEKKKATEMDELSNVHHVVTNDVLLNVELSCTMKQ